MSFGVFFCALVSLVVTSNAVKSAGKNFIPPSDFETLKGSFSGEAATYATGYSSTGWITKGSFEGGDCTNPLIVAGMSANVCYIDEGFAYKILLAQGNFFFLKGLLCSLIYDCFLVINYFKITVATGSSSIFMIRTASSMQGTAP